MCVPYPGPLPHELSVSREDCYDCHTYCNDCHTYYQILFTSEKYICTGSDTGGRDAHLCSDAHHVTVQNATGTARVHRTCSQPATGYALDLSGKPACLMDENSPDWLPSVNLGHSQ